MTRSKNCTVHASNGANDIKNLACIKKVAKHVTDPQYNDIKLVYVAHGWSHTNPWGDNVDGWLLNLKDSLFKRYKKGHIVVGIIHWDYGSRFPAITPSNSSSFTSK